MTQSEAVTKDAPPAAKLLQMMTGYWVSQSIYVAAKLGLADLVAQGTRSCDELAALTHTHAPSLYRLMRALAGVGVFTEVSRGRFGMTPMAELLRSGTPDSMRALGIIYSDPCYGAWGDVLHSIQTGESAFERQYGMTAFEYFAAHPEVDQIFNEAMVNYTNQLAGAVVNSYDFSGFETVVDVGGGYGALLVAILRQCPATNGVLFDLPHVVERARAYLLGEGMTDRCRCEGGDFFESVPGGGDAYVLEQILHDWDDDRCLQILRRCREAIPAHGKLLVVELEVPQGDEVSFGKWMDLHMLVMTPGGRNRTNEEYAKLFAASGFELAGVTPTPLGAGIVEAVPV